RPDLAGREQEMAGRLHETLRAKLLVLPAELEVYPGHQAGSACGAGLSGKPASTLAFEKRFNPMLSLDRDEFVRALTADIPPPPAGMTAIVAANLGGGAPAAVAA
ncbi:MAG TPA: MBL fold metallo-hydrolase, partial [Ramlibacter sp.]